MKEIQNFSFLDIISVFGSLGLVLSAIGFVLYNSLEDPGLKRAQRTAHALSGQLVAGGVKSHPEGSFEVDRGEDRGPASLKSGLFLQKGEISKDPWGNAYSYQFVFDENGEPKVLYVWSNGPNGRQDTRSRELAKKFSYNRNQSSFKGDDIGVARPLTAKLLARGRNL